MGNTAICGWCCSKSSQPKSDDDESSPAQHFDDENEDGHNTHNNLTPLPPVKYGPCLEYDLRFPPFVTDAKHHCPEKKIDDILGTYDVLISAPGGFRYRKYLTTSDDDEESLLVTRDEDGRIKFELICKSNKIENRHDYQGWTCFSDDTGIIEYFDEEHPAIIRIENSKDPFPDNFMGQRYGTVRFVDRRSATFYAGKEPCREKSRCPPMVGGMKQAVKKLSDFATTRKDSNHWIHRWLGLPVEIAAEVKQFLLVTPLPPPVFFFEKDDLVLDTYAYDDSWADVVYIARKRPCDMM
mmetsp:Transcript_7907/g.12360  ORF Transcript_7907/g.12360 Transcript_7907/m.12360 type:complete len:296 (-) Transcript_7907:295-1182(-)